MQNKLLFEYQNQTIQKLLFINKKPSSKFLLDFVLLHYKTKVTLLALQFNFEDPNLLTLALQFTLVVDHITFDKISTT